MTSESKLQEVISSFYCTKNPDIKHFLENRAVPFEQFSKSKTYFLMDEEQLLNKKYAVMAYFTVALKVLKIADLDLSNRAIKELDGYSAKVSGEVISELPVYLIGQLAKNDTYKHDISGNFVLENAMSVISAAQEKVGGRIVLIECDNVESLLRFYTNNAFHVIREDSDKYIQLIRMIV